MNEVEEKLKQMRLRQPSADLDEKIARACAQAEWGARASRVHAISWWTAAFAASAAVVLTFFSFEPRHSHLTGGTRDDVILYEFRAEGEMREMLTAPPAAADVIGPSSFKVISQ